jgi:hypothetical protein
MDYLTRVMMLGNDGSDGPRQELLERFPSSRLVSSRSLPSIIMTILSRRQNPIHHGRQCAHQLSVSPQLKLDPSVHRQNIDSKLYLRKYTTSKEMKTLHYLRPHESVINNPINHAQA